MRNINERFVRETYDSNGLLTKFEVNLPDNFNFAYDILDDIAENDPNRRAMIWCNPQGDERTFTFEEMSKISNKAANYFASLGIGKGDFVMLILRRDWRFWPILMALHKLGAIAVPASCMLTAHDIVYRVNSADIKAVICTSRGNTMDATNAAQPSCPSLTLKIVTEGIFPGWKEFDDGIKDMSDTFERIDTKVTEPMVMYFSSGTSGNPKMVLHDYAYAAAHIVTAKHWHNVNPEGVHFTISDTGWMKALWGKLYGQWFMEACVFVYDFDKFNPAEILTLMEKYQITTLCCPSTMYRFFLREGVDKYNLSSLEYATVAGEPLNPDLFAKWEKDTGVMLMEGFGQTETTLTVGNLKGTTPKPGSMGKPSPGYTIDLFDADDKPVRTGQTGEVVIKADPKPAGLMIGYYRDDKRNAETIRNGWYHTGDTAWRDEDGYLNFVGRNDDIIKSSGYRIGPFEVESVLLEHDAVAECAVTGVPDDLRGNIVKATIVLAAGYEGTEELTKELQNFVKKETAPYKYPRVIEYVSELPRTVNGKIRRVAIRKNDENNK